MTINISIPAIRALARRDGSDLVQQATDAIVDRYISDNIGRPAATANWLASEAASGAEFDSLCRQLQAALRDGSVLDIEPADDKAMRVFGRLVPPVAKDAVSALTQEAAGRQIFLARRLYTLAGDIVDDAGADISDGGKALAVGASLYVMARLYAPTSREVIKVLPIDEWQALRAAWRAVIDRAAG